MTITRQIDIRNDVTLVSENDLTCTSFPGRNCKMTDCQLSPKFDISERQLATWEVSITAIILTVLY